MLTLLTAWYTSNSKWDFGLRWCNLVLVLLPSLIYTEVNQNLIWSWTCMMRSGMSISYVSKSVWKRYIELKYDIHVMFGYEFQQSVTMVHRYCKKATELVLDGMWSRSHLIRSVLQKSHAYRYIWFITSIFDLTYYITFYQDIYMSVSFS